MLEQGTAAAAYVGASVVRSYLLASLPFVALGGGLWITLATRGVQFRRLGRALATARSGRGVRLAGLLAGSVGVGSVAAAALALEAAGPGAIAWMWIVAILGMGVSWAEVTVSARLPGSEGAAPGPITAARAGLGRLGGALGLLYALSLLTSTVAVGAVFQAEQTGQWMRELMSVRPEITAILLALATAGLVLLSPTRAHRWASRLALPLLGIYVLGALIVIGGAAGEAGAALSTIITEAFSAETFGAGLLSGGLVVVLQTAVLRSTLAHEAGLGTLAIAATASVDEDEPEDTQRPALLAMLVPAITTLGLGTLTALVVMLSGASQRERAAERLFLPLAQLERHEITASELGQAFTLPEHTALASKRRYRMVMRANPRGHKVGTLANDERTVGMPAWENAAAVDTLYFRHKDERGQHEAFDVAVPCERVDTDLAGVPWIELTPKDPELNLRIMMRGRELDGPFVHLGDVEFPGVVLPSVRRGEADTEGAQETLTLFEEPKSEGSPHNPSLRSLVTLGFAGPYVVGPAGQERPPWGLIAAEGFSPAPGSLAHLRFLSPARGLDVGFLNPRGELELPAWAFLTAADTAIVRHREDPSRDFPVPVTYELREDRLLFTSVAPDFTFADLRTLTDYEPRPYLVAPPYSMTVEVHEGARLPVEYRERRALIPVDDYQAPLAAGLRRANPREVLATRMIGPLVDHDGAGVVASGFLRELPRPLAWLVALSLLGMVALTLRAWAHHGAAAFASLLGNNGWVRAVFLAMFVLLIAIGASYPLYHLIRWIDASLALTLQLQLVLLLLLTPHVFRASRDA